MANTQGREGGGPTRTDGWARIDPTVYRQGWDCAARGGDKYRDNEYLGAGPRAAFEQGYDDFMAEREKDRPA